MRQPSPSPSFAGNVGGLGTADTDLVPPDTATDTAGGLGTARDGGAIAVSVLAVVLALAVLALARREGSRQPG